MKNILILGVSSQVGREIANKYITLGGTNVYGTYNSNSLENMDINLIKLDLLNTESKNRFLNSITSIKFDLIVDTISCSLILNKFEKFSVDAFKNSLNFSLFSKIDLFQNLITKMNLNSNIIFILSEVLDVSKPLIYSSPYIISKYALLGLIQSLSFELKNKKINVNGISPGMMDTPFVSKFPKFMVEMYDKNYGLVKPSKVADKVLEVIELAETGKNYFVVGK